MTKTDLFANGDAIISHCGRHRYLLTREWASGPTATFIMLNPSTADASNDDPTIRRCIGFAKREGCGRLAVVNLYSMRATDPRDVSRAMWPNGPDAIQHLGDALDAADGPVICAWGADPVAIGRRDLVLGMIRDAGKRPMCLGMSKGGSPRHPLYLRSDAPLVPFGCSA
jgi:hypothetical protein